MITAAGPAVILNILRDVRLWLGGAAIERGPKIKGIFYRDKIDVHQGLRAEAALVGDVLIRCAVKFDHGN